MIKPENVMSVLITNGENLKSLVVTRAIGRKGIKVKIGSNSRIPASAFSRYCNSFFRYPSPQNNPKKFIESIIRNLENIDLIIPINSKETLLIAKYKNKFEKYCKVPLADYNKMSMINNKYKLTRLAEELDINVAKTQKVEDISTINKDFNIGFPVVIKLQEESGGRGLSYANSKEELLYRLKETTEKYNLRPSQYPIVQEYIKGIGVGCAALYNHSDCKVLFTYKNIREYPITGGTCSLRESTDDKTLKMITKRILDGLEWHGIAHFDFIWDKKRKKYFLIDGNPRIWTSINLPIVSGIDFPYLLYKMMIEGDIPRINSYKIGTKSKIFLLDSMALLSYAINNSRIPYKKVGFFARNIRYDDISLNDPLPFFLLAIRGLRHRSMT